MDTEPGTSPRPGRAGSRGRDRGRRPSPTEPTSTPSPKRPTRPRSDSSSMAERAGEHVEIDRCSRSASSAREPVEGQLDPLGRLALDGRPAVCGVDCRRACHRAAHAPTSPRSLQGCGVAAAASSWSIRSSTNVRSAGPLERIAHATCPTPIAVARDPRRRASAFASSCSASAQQAARPSRPAPPTTPASRDRRSHAVTGCQAAVDRAPVPRTTRRTRPGGGTRATGARAAAGASGRRAGPRSGRRSRRWPVMPAATSCSWTSRS